MRAFPRLASAHQRRRDRVGGVEAGAEIADRDPAFDRRTTLLAGDAHQAGHSLHGHVEGAFSGIRPALPIPGNRAIDDAAIERFQRIVAETEPPEHAGAEVLQHDVGDGAQRLQLRKARGILQIDRDRPLVAVDRRKIFAERRPAVGRGERRPAAHAVAARRILHLDDVGAEIGEQRARKGPRRDLSKFEDADPRQRSVAFAVARSAHASAPARNAAQRITALPMRAAPIPRLAPSPALARAADRRRSCGHVAAPGRA